jgi:hypothetical protein
MMMYVPLAESSLVLLAYGAKIAITEEDVSRACQVF